MVALPRPITGDLFVDAEIHQLCDQFRAFLDAGGRHSVDPFLVHILPQLRSTVRRELETVLLAFLRSGYKFEKSEPPRHATVLNMVTNMVYDNARPRRRYPEDQSGY